MKLQVNLRSVKRNGREILHNIEFSLDSGMRLAILGRNGSGKSTLLSAIASLIPAEGELLFDDSDLKTIAPRRRATLLSALFQDIPHTALTVRELISLGREVHRAPFTAFSETDRSRIAYALERAELTTLADRPCYSLSGGELRRAYYGMLLAQDTPVVLLDEATAFMDADYAEHFYALADRMAREGKCVVSVMHDLSGAISHSDLILLLDGGTQRFFGTPEALLKTTIIEEIFAVKRYTCGEKVFFATKEVEQ